MKWKLLLFSLFFMFSSEIYSQTQDSPWVIGVSANAIDFFPTKMNPELTGNDVGMFNEITNAEDHWNVSIPKFFVTRYFRDKISVNASIAFNNIKRLGDNKIKSKHYKSFDAAVQYYFLGAENWLSPYAYAGGGYAVIGDSGWGTLNAGVGFSLWFSPNFGLNVEAGYKHSNKVPHFNYSLGVVMKLGDFGGGSSGNCFY